MKKLLFTFFLLFLACGVQGQNISQEELTAFCERAIENKFSDSLTHKAILMELDSSFPIVKKQYTSFFIQFVTQKEAVKLAKKSKTKAVWVNYAKIEVIDTHHIAIYASTDGRSYNVKHLENKPIVVSYEGICKQKPDATLIFDQQKQTWECWSKEAIATQEKKDFLNSLKKK